MIRGALNDTGRALLGTLIGAMALGFDVGWFQRIRNFDLNQDRLRKAYGIGSATPIHPYGPEIREAIEAFASRALTSISWATTSGSTSEPKRIAFTRKRLFKTQLEWIGVYCRMVRHLGIRRRSLYLFSSLADDELEPSRGPLLPGPRTPSALTALLLTTNEPGRVALLQAPYRAHQYPELQAFAAIHGQTAARFLVLAISNPGVLYATNPSTLVAFFAAVETEWQKLRKLAAETLDSPETPAIRRLESKGWRERLNEIVASPAPLQANKWLPGLETVVCWKGGYLNPFLQALTRRLPRTRLVPMYSMSTETIETLTHFEGPEEPSAFPLAPGVLYEFLPVDEKDAPKHLLNPKDLQPGKAYCMVVSDAFGLARYQTGDVFECRQNRYGMPDLRFMRRRDLEYSFTGEKLTAHQLEQVFEGLRSRHPELEDSALICAPTFPEGETLPHYELLVIPLGGPNPTLDLENLANEAETALLMLNGEYKAKIASNRLRPLHSTLVDRQEFAKSIGANLEAQYKFLPLQRTLWTRPK